MRKISRIGIWGLWVIGLSLFGRADAPQQPLYQRLENPPGSTQRQAQLAAEIRQAIQKHGTPFLEGKIVTFFFDSPTATDVQIAGNWKRWRPERMWRLGDTGLFWRTEKFDALVQQVEYRFIVDGEFRLDPANPRRGHKSPEEEVSTFLLHGREEEEPNLPTLRGRMESFEIKSSILNNKRTILIYLPPGYDEGSSRLYPSLYVHDGPGYIKNQKIDITTDRLISEGKIEPIILVLVPAVHRRQEYQYEADRFIRFIAEELIPAVDSRYRTDRRSLGGLIAFRLAITRPDLFGRVLSQSGSFQMDGRAIVKQVDSIPKPDIKVWLDFGSLEGGLTKANRAMLEVLKKHGWNFQVMEKPTRHSGGAWRERLPEALAWLWSKQSAQDAKKADEKAKP
jgi:enterochelin esterase-like enzyme